MLKTVGKWLVSCIGYMLYTLALLLLLLWLFFPKDTLRGHLVQYLNGAYPGLRWQVQSLTLHVPAGITVAGIKGYAAQGNLKPLVQFDSLVLRPLLAEMLHTKRLQAEYQLSLAQGIVGGTLQRAAGHKEFHVDGSIQGLELAECTLLAGLLRRNLQGSLSATFAGTFDPSLGKISALEAKLRIDNGLLELKHPLLNHSTLPFSQMGFTLHSRGETVQVEQGVVASELFSGQFAGEIQLRREPAASLLDIRGTLQPRPEFFKGVNTTPVLESIQVQLKNKPLPYRVSGELYNPGIHFEEFSMLFQSLEKELK